MSLTVQRSPQQSADELFQAGLKQIKVLEAALPEHDKKAIQSAIDFFSHSTKELILRNVASGNTEFVPIKFVTALFQALSSQDLHWQFETQYKIAKVARLFMEIAYMKSKAEGIELPKPMRIILREQIDGLLDQAPEHAVGLRYELECSSEALKLMTSKTKEYAIQIFEVLKEGTDLSIGSAVATSLKLAALIPGMIKDLSREWYTDALMTNWFKFVAREDKLLFQEIHKTLSPQLGKLEIAQTAVEFFGDIVQHGTSDLAIQALEGKPGLLTLLDYRNPEEDRIKTKKWPVRYRVVQILSSLALHPDRTIASIAAKALYRAYRIEGDKHKPLRRLLDEVVKRLDVQVQWRLSEEETRQLQAELLGKQDQIQQRLQEYSEQIARLQRDLGVAKEGRSASDAEVQRIQADLFAEQAKLRDKEQQIQTLQARVAQLESNLAVQVQSSSDVRVKRACAKILSAPMDGKVQHLSGGQMMAQELPLEVIELDPGYGPARDWSKMELHREFKDKKSLYSKQVIELQDGSLASASSYGVVLWDRNSGYLRRLHSMLEQDEVNTVAELGDGRLISGLQNHTIIIWKMELSLVNAVATFIQHFWANYCDKTFTGHTGAVKTLIKLMDGNIASGSADKTIKIWNLQGSCLSTFTGHNGSVEILIECKNGLLASGSQDKTIKIWDRIRLQCLSTFTGHTEAVTSLIERMNGTFVSAAETVKIWNAKGKCLQTFVGYVDCNCTLIEQLSQQIYTYSIVGPRGSSSVLIKSEDKFNRLRVGALIELNNGTLVLSQKYFFSAILLVDRNYMIIKIIDLQRSSIHWLTKLRDGTLASDGRDGSIRIWSAPPIE